MLFGIDALGLARWPKEAIRALPKGFALGVFANTFGDVWPILRRQAATGKFPRIRVHAIWEDNHRYVPATHDRVIEAEFAKFIDLTKKLPGVEWQFSPFCEVEGDLTNVLRELRKEWAGLVNSIWRAPLVLPRVAQNEIHGEKQPVSGSYIYSCDGDSSVDVDISNWKRLHSRASTFYFWHPAFNGRLKTDDPTPRPDRKAWPTSELVQSVAFLANREGRTNLPPMWIFKTHADRHDTPPEPRAYKPVMIAPIKVSKLLLVAANKKVIAELPYGKLYQDNVRHTYRGDIFGYQIAQKAARLAGTPVCTVTDAAGTAYGKVNPGFREGEYR